MSLPCSFFSCSRTALISCSSLDAFRVPPHDPQVILKSAIFFAPPAGSREITRPPAVLLHYGLGPPSPYVLVLTFSAPLPMAARRSLLNAQWRQGHSLLIAGVGQQHELRISLPALSGGQSERGDELPLVVNPDAPDDWLRAQWRISPNGLSERDDDLGPLRPTLTSDSERHADRHRDGTDGNGRLLRGGRRFGRWRCLHGRLDGRRLGRWRLGRWRCLRRWLGRWLGGRELSSLRGPRRRLGRWRCLWGLLGRWRLGRRRGLRGRLGGWRRRGGSLGRQRYVSGRWGLLGRRGGPWRLCGLVGIRRLRCGRGQKDGEPCRRNNLLVRRVGHNQDQGHLPLAAIAHP